MYYKECAKKIWLGGSDIACLIAVGCVSDDEFQNSTDVLRCLPIHFGGDGFYQAYLVDENAEIGSHYEIVARFGSWLRIYDDNQLVFNHNAKMFEIYRAGNYGMIIRMIEPGVGFFDKVIYI